MEYKHIPVMLDLVLEYLNPSSGQNFIDCTLGGGSYTSAIAEKITPGGRILSVDRDSLAINNAKKQLTVDNVLIVHDNYKNISQIVSDNWDGAVGFDGIVMDLGLSSAQLDDRDRGFSFLKDAPLNMGMGCNEDLDTEYIVNFWSKKELKRIIREYGEERYAEGISEGIRRFRKDEKIETTGQLLEIIKNSVPKSYVNSKHLHFATRTFQALRIATNQELDGLEKALPQAIELLKPGGRLAVVSFHSLEDRIVKQFFKKESKECICPPEIPICVCEHEAKIKIITKKIVVPHDDEIKNNPRSRSAKMRVAEKI